MYRRRESVVVGSMSHLMGTLGPTGVSSVHLSPRGGGGVCVIRHRVGCGTGRFPITLSDGADICQTDMFTCTLVGRLSDKGDN